MSACEICLEMCDPPTEETEEMCTSEETEVCVLNQSSTIMQIKSIHVVGGGGGIITGGERIWWERSK